MRVAGKIFVNYRRDDAKAEAARLHDRLAQSFGAANVFMDVDNLLPGERFDLRLKEALAGTDVFLAVIGARWLTLLEARAQSGERDYVREEIAAALAAKLVVIPVLMDRAPLPKAASLPGDIRELALYHKHDVVYESFGRDVQALIAAIETHRQAAGVKRAAESGGLARETGQAEIDAARRTRQKAKEEAGAERRAQMEQETRAKPRAEPAAFPWKPAAAVVAVAAVVILLIAQPWQRRPEFSRPAVTDPPHVVSAPAETCEDGVLVAVAVGKKPCIKPGSGESFKDCADCPEMVAVPAGSFLMGSVEGEEGRFDNEGPRHKVTIPKPFAVGRSNVTRGQFANFVKTTGYRTDGGCLTMSGTEWKHDANASWRSLGFDQSEDHPVVCMNWNDATAFAAWLAKTTGQPYRLLSEAEAEYAVRGVTKATAQPRFFFGNSAEMLCTYANIMDETMKASGKVPSSWSYPSCDDGYVFTAPVMSFQPNAFGLYDVHGNAWTWTQDCWNNSYIGAPANGSAWTAGDCGSRVSRGGGWSNHPLNLRAAYRVRSPLTFRSDGMGFRVARTLTP